MSFIFYAACVIQRIRFVQRILHSAFVVVALYNGVFFLCVFFEQRIPYITFFQIDMLEIITQLAFLEESHTRSCGTRQSCVTPSLSINSHFRGCSIDFCRGSISCCRLICNVRRPVAREIPVIRLVRETKH